MSIINRNWFSVSEDDDVKFLNEDLTQKLENKIKVLDEKLENKIKVLDEKINKIHELEEKLKTIEINCSKIINENLKVINRVLEAEVSIERTKNILLRKNISFPFTPLSTKMLL